MPADRVEGHKLRTRERRPANRTKVGSAVIRHDSEQIKIVFAFGGVRMKNGKIEIKQKFDRLLSLIKRFRFEK